MKRDKKNKQRKRIKEITFAKDWLAEERNIPTLLREMLMITLISIFIQCLKNGSIVLSIRLINH